MSILSNLFSMPIREVNLITRYLFLVLLSALTSTSLSGQRKTNAEEFKRQVHDLSEILQLPGFSLAVVKDGKVVCRQMEGYSSIEKKTAIREHDIFAIASLTKTFTANLMMQYEQEHKASIDDYLLNYRFIDLNFGWPFNVDVNTKVRHVLSQTSEDGPGNSFVYSGSRFNFIYGLFEAVGPYTSEIDAFSLELHKRILTPLHMNSTFSGFPKSSLDTLYRHIVTPYIYDKINNRYIEDAGTYNNCNRSFPSGGIVSSVEDLIKYTNSYDDQALITKESYTKVTTPTILKDGTYSPYGLGWFTETFAGKQIHWHYGQAESSASLFVRVPESGYTFIFLANSNAPSEALRLGSGQIWQSPLAAVFLNNFIFPVDREARKLLETESSIGESLFFRYTENRTGMYKGIAKSRMEELAKVNPSRFDQYDPGLIYLLTDLNVRTLDFFVDRLALSYKNHKHIQPYVIVDLGNYYRNLGMNGQAIEFYKMLADANGFEFWPQSSEAALKTAVLLRKIGDDSQARKYYWQAVKFMKLQFASDASIQIIVDQMNGG